MTIGRTRRFERFVLCAAPIWVAILAGPANGITIRVPENYPTITDALLWATHGDEIVVSPGVYIENINIGGKNVVLRSVNPTDTATVAATIIDGNKKGPVVTFAGTETSNCVLKGFTVRNGKTDYDGGGILGNSTRSRIEYNTITDNSAAYMGGGGLSGCNGTIQNNTISRNSASHYSGGYGGGLWQCNGTIQNNVITGNSASGQYGRGGGLHWCNGTIQNNEITSNSAGLDGGGLYQCLGTIRNNTIIGNSATNQGGGLFGCTGAIVNCIIWGNTAPVYSQISADCSIPNYSCIQGYTVGQGQGNIGLNPRFVGPNNFHLLPDSPCIDAGTNANCPATDKDGNPRPSDGNGDGQAVCDMGAYEYVPRTAVRQRCWMLYR